MRDMNSRASTLLITLTVAATGWAVPPAAAASAPTDFPTKAQVKQTVGGKGAWTSYPFSVKSLGSKPQACRSDRQMLSPSMVRARSYHGPVLGMPQSITSNAQIAVFRYPSVAEARAVVVNNASYPIRCPKVVEWVCTQCDGVWTTWRTKVRAPKVGAQRTAWRFREVGNFKSNGYAMVARRGTTVVRVSVSRTRDVWGPQGWTYPPLVPKRTMVRLTRQALAAAL